MMWRDIPGYGGRYQVGSHGLVRTLNWRNTGRTALLKFSTDQKGYYRIPLQGKTHKVHRLVAQAFISNVASLPQVNHKNGLKTDNRVENLEWVTNKENSTHAWQNGLFKSRKGELNAHAKLTPAIVEAIRLMYTPGKIKQSEIAMMFDITQAHVSSIVRGERWT